MSKALQGTTDANKALFILASYLDLLLIRLILASC